MLTHLSLFSGIGGFDIAAEWAGFRTICFVEINPFRQKILRQMWSNAVIYGDINEFKGTQYRGKIDLITAGVPCQPSSVAGKRRGKDDDRWLWAQTFKALSQVRSTWVCCENPTGIISMEFEGLLAEMENQGYETQPIIIPACAVNAPHRRDRVFIIAYSDDNGRARRRSLERGRQDKDTKKRETTESKQGAKGRLGIPSKVPKAATITAGNRLEGQLGQVDSQRWASEALLTEGIWRGWPFSIPTPIVCRGYDGVPDRKHRTEALGDAVVPAQAYPILKAIADTYSQPQWSRKEEQP